MQWTPPCTQAKEMRKLPLPWSERSESGEELELTTATEPPQCLSDSRSTNTKTLLSGCKVRKMVALSATERGTRTCKSLKVRGFTVLSLLFLVASFRNEFRKWRRVLWTKFWDFSNWAKGIGLSWFKRYLWAKGVFSKPNQLFEKKKIGSPTEFIK